METGSRSIDFRSDRPIKIHALRLSITPQLHELGLHTSNMEDEAQNGHRMFKLFFSFRHFRQ